MNIQLIANQAVTWVQRSAKHTGHIVAVVNKGDNILKVAKKLGITLNEGVSPVTKFNRVIIESDNNGEVIYYTPSAGLLKKMVADVAINDELAILDEFQHKFSTVKKQLADKVRTMKACEQDIAALKAELQDAYDEYATVKAEVDNLKRSLGIALGNEVPASEPKQLTARTGKMGDTVPEWLNAFINRQFSPSDIINRNASLRGKYHSVHQKLTALTNSGILCKVDRGLYAFAS